MKTKKRIGSAILALLMALSVTGCTKDGGEESSHVDKVKVDSTAAADAIAAIPDGAQKELIWMGTYDLNPMEGKEKSVAMSLFEKKGGSIKWTKVIDAQKYDKLATAITSGKDVPDIFKYEWIAFPSQVVTGMYQPVDDIVDFDADIWKGVKDTANQFELKGKHYVAPISFAVGTLMMYDKDIIDNEGLDDPYDLYQKGEWNWDTWYDIMSAYKKNATGDQERYGVVGWFAPQLVQQTGQTLVTYEDGVFKNNLKNPDIERAENFIYDLGKEGLVDLNWYGSAKSCFEAGQTLFYNMGIWAMSGTAGPTADDNWKVVPIPKDPQNDEKVISGDMLAYMWVKGSTAKEAVKCWYECERVATFDESYRETATKKFLQDNPGWTEEMYQVYLDESSNDNKNVFDFGYGVSTTLASDDSAAGKRAPIGALYEDIYKPDDSGVQKTWTALKNMYSGTIDSELKMINEKIKDFK